MEVLNDFLNDLLLKGFSKKTHKAYKIALCEYFNWVLKHNIDWEKISFRSASEFVKYLMNERKLSSSSVCLKLSAVRSFYAYTVKKGLIEADPFCEITIKRKGLKLPRVLTDREKHDIATFFDNNNDDESILYSALFHFFYSTGARLSEVINIKDKDIDWNQNRVIIMGKGGKERYLLFDDECKRFLKKYYSNREIIKQNDEGYFFIQQKNRKKIDENYIHSLFLKVKNKLNIQGRFSPHVFRHTIATDLLSNGLDIRYVQEFLGHSSIAATQIYTHLSYQKLQEIYNRVHPRGES